MGFLFTCKLLARAGDEMLFVQERRDLPEEVI